MLNESFQIFHWRWNLQLDRRKQVCACNNNCGLKLWYFSSLKCIVECWCLLLCLNTPSALEHLRKKIEMSTERIRLGKLKEEEARKVCVFQYITQLSPLSNVKINGIHSNHHTTYFITCILLPLYAISWISKMLHLLDSGYNILIAFPFPSLWSFFECRLCSVKYHWNRAVFSMLSYPPPLLKS